MTLTEVDLRIIIDRDVDLLLSLCGTPVVLRRIVVGNRLHGSLNELMALIFKALAIAHVARVDTAAEVVVLGSRRRGSISFVGNNVIDPQLLADLLNSQVQRVRFELFLGQIADESSGQAHETSGLVLEGIAPPIALATLCAVSISIYAHHVSLK